MKILHIASIRNNPCNGVCVIAPKHVYYQAQFENVCFVNINNEKIDGVDCQKEYDDDLKFLDNCFNGNDIDLVVFHEVYRIEYIKIYKKLLKKKIKYIIIPHGELSKNAQKKKWIKKKIANILIFNRFVNNSSGVQCLSNEELNQTNITCYKFIGTNGVDLREIDECNNNQISNNGIVFTYIGRLDIQHKGLDLLIKSVSSISNYLREKKCEFFIYGPDHKGRYENVENLIKQYNVLDLIHLNHEVSGDKKRTILLNSNYFIQTSRYEGMPLGILEALSLGIPCIVTDGTNLSKQVDEYKAGWTAKCNIKSISDAIKMAIEHKDQYSYLSYNAINLIKKNFDWNYVSESTIAEYNRLLRK